MLGPLADFGKSFVAPFRKSSIAKEPTSEVHHVLPFGFPIRAVTARIRQHEIGIRNCAAGRHNAASFAFGLGFAKQKHRLEHTVLQAIICS